MSKNNNKNFRVGSTRHYKLGRVSRSTHFFICLTQIFWGYHWSHQNSEMLTITEYGKYQEILTSQQIKEEEFFFFRTWRFILKDIWWRWSYIFSFSIFINICMTIIFNIITSPREVRKQLHVYIYILLKIFTTPYNHSVGFLQIFQASWHKSVLLQKLLWILNKIFRFKSYICFHLILSKQKFCSALYITDCRAKKRSLFKISLLK